MALGPSKSADSPRNDALKTGPPLVGIVLNWWLYGILIMQYLLYCKHAANKDNKFLKAIVHTLFMLDTVQTIMTMVDAFHWFVYNFGNYDAMLEFGVASIDSPFMDGIIALTVQLVYCWRVWVLSKWRVFPVIVSFLALVGGVNGMLVGIYDRIIKIVPNAKPGFYVPVMLWLWASAVTDILIATSMTYLLVKFRRQPASENVMVAMGRLLILTLETNILTAAVAMATVIMFLVKPVAPPLTNFHLTGGYILGKLYSNCFMVLLNQRLYHENHPQGRTGARGLGSPRWNTSGRDAFAGTNSSITGKHIYSNPGTLGEISVTSSVKAPKQVELKSNANDDVEMGGMEQYCKSDSYEGIRSSCPPVADFRPA